MPTPIIYGPAFSTYVRSVRLAMEEKPAAYELLELNAFAGEHKQPDHLARHPFGKVPALEHDGRVVYETSAILRYIDRVFPGRTLQPGELGRETRMNQAMSVVDCYTYPCVISRMVLPRFFGSKTGAPVDEAAIAQAMPDIRNALGALAKLQGEDPFLAGPEISLADLMLAPVFGYLMTMPEADELVTPHAGLAAWWERVASRQSWARTEPKRR